MGIQQKSDGPFVVPAGRRQKRDRFRETQARFIPRGAIARDRTCVDHIRCGSRAPWRQAGPYL